jgi:hypothetical protein
MNDRVCAIAFGTVAGREPSPTVSALRATINYRKEGEQ